MIFDGASLPLVIGLFAPWGAGKSFILEKVETHMKYLILKRDLDNLRDILKTCFDRCLEDLYLIFNKLTKYKGLRDSLPNQIHYGLKNYFDNLRPDQMKFTSARFIEAWKEEWDKFSTNTSRTVEQQLQVMKGKLSEELFRDSEVWKLITKALDNLDQLKDSEPDQLTRIFKWCEVLGGPEPTESSFDSDTLNFSDEYLTDLEPAKVSNLSFLIWNLGMIISPVIALLRHVFGRDYVAPEYRLLVTYLLPSTWGSGFVRSIWANLRLRRLCLGSEPEGEADKRRSLVSALWLYNVAKRSLPRRSWGKQEAADKKDFHFLFS